jgi:ATP-dependent HslUV protease ATP-binding subunit HslU
MEDISFAAPNMRKKKITIDRAYVQKQLKDIIEDEDLSRFIL